MMNYSSRDYAVNKNSSGIVYRFVDETVEIDPGDYLAANPGKPINDFLELKAISDSIWREQDRADYNQSRKNITIFRLKSTSDPHAIPLDEAYIEAEEYKSALVALAMLMSNGKLTETQKRRFLLHIFGGLSIREIAKREAVYPNAIEQSIQVACSKLKKFYLF